MELAAIATVLAALGGVVKLVLDALAKADDRHNLTLERMAAQQAAAIVEIQTRQEKFLGNHMSKNTAALEAVAKRLERVEEVVKVGR